jgi:hypothetical protein
LSTSRATAPRRPIETEVTPQRIRARSAGSDSANDLPCAATDGVHRSGSLENRLSCLQLVGTNLIYPRRQRFHDDDPAESSKAASLSARALYSSVAQFSSQISFAGTTPFKDSSSRVEGHLHDFRLSIGGTLLQALFFLVLEGRGFFADLDCRRCATVIRFSASLEAIRGWDAERAIQRPPCSCRRSSLAAPRASRLSPGASERVLSPASD